MLRLQWSERHAQIVPSKLHRLYNTFHNESCCRSRILSPLSRKRPRDSTNIRNIWKWLLRSILSIEWPWKWLSERLPLLQLDEFMSSQGRYFYYCIGFISSRHEVKILHFLSQVHQVVEATAMRWRLHMAFWRPFYIQKCLQLYRRDAFRELKSVLSLRLPRCLGRRTLKPFILNGLEGRKTGRNTSILGNCWGIDPSGNH